MFAFHLNGPLPLRSEGDPSQQAHHDDVRRDLPECGHGLVVDTREGPKFSTPNSSPPGFELRKLPGQCFHEEIITPTRVGISGPAVAVANLAVFQEAGASEVGVQILLGTEPQYHRARRMEN